MQKLLSIESARQRLSLGRSAFYNLLTTNQVDSVTIGRRRLVPDEALDRYIQRLLAEQRQDGEAAP